MLSKALLMLPVPTLALRIVLGEMARVVVFSQRVSAQKILDTGFTFSFDKVDKAFWICIHIEYQSELRLM